MMRIDLVVCDLAGTTVHDPDAVGMCLRAALHAAGATVTPEAVNAAMGLPKPEALRQIIAGLPSAASLLPRLADIHADFLARMKLFYQTDAGVREIAGANATFAALRRAGVRIGLNTGFNRETTNIVLERLGWREGETFDASVTSDEVAHGRPYPDMIQHLMTKLGVTDPAHVAKVGDTPADLEEGMRAGCGLVIGVTQGTHTRAQLAAFPHSALIESIADLPAYFDEQHVWPLVGV